MLVAFIDCSQSCKCLLIQQIKLVGDSQGDALEIRARRVTKASILGVSKLIWRIMAVA